MGINTKEYTDVHNWVREQLGTPKVCEICHTEDENKKYNWSNKDHKYAKDLKDWQRVCIKCHRKYDEENIFITIQGVCVHCGNTFETKKQGRRFCDSKCANKYAKSKIKEAEVAEKLSFKTVFEHMSTQCIPRRKKTILR